jgi:chemotaxis response regulator CheB
VLTGLLSDGSDGILAVHRSGGATMAQDYRSAQFPDMPIAAIDLGKTDLTLSLEGISDALDFLAERGVE